MSQWGEKVIDRITFQDKEYEYTVVPLYAGDPFYPPYKPLKIERIQVIEIREIFSGDTLSGVPTELFEAIKKKEISKLPQSPQ